MLIKRLKGVKTPYKVLIGLAAVVLLAVGLYYVPPIHSKLAWRLENLQTSIYYIFHPPQRVAFGQTAQPLLTQTPDLPAATPTPFPTELATPTITATPLPQSVVLDVVTFVDQMHRWNYCGPANLAMALEYWGWKGEPGDAMDLRDQIASVVKPGVDDPALDFIQRSQTDVNVMPYELVDYVNDHTTLRALYRYGGDAGLVRRLISAGFPVIAEKGIYQTLPPENTMQWAGHYAFTTGYDESTQEFIYQDSYTPDESRPYRDQGYNTHISYAEYISGWRAFDYVFIVVYRPEQESALYQALGNWADEGWAIQNALQTARQESQSLTGVDQFFAAFNEGTSYGLLADYGNASVAYDRAFSLYDLLPEAGRPYRVMWYQTGPYRAYYYTSQYERVVSLSEAVQSTLYSHRVLEETLYWRALAEAALGEYDQAYADLRTAYHYNRGLQAVVQLMEDWGVSP
jgi:tetratricopeptide (TPR) repeat protein